MSSTNDVTDFLTEGSVWTRVKGKLKGHQVRLLLLTNTILIGTEEEEAHPVQVIYANAKNQIFNRSVDDFCRLFQFNHVDPVLEARLLGIFAEEAEDDEDDEDEGEAADSDDQAVDALFSAPSQTEAHKSLAESIMEELQDPAEVEASADLGIKFTISDIEGYTAPTLTAEDLEEALVGYVQEPAWSHGLLSHRLTFRLGGPVSLATLREAFDPDGSMNTVASFAGVVAGTFTNVPWTQWIGVFPEVVGGDHYAAVHVGTTFPGHGETEEDEDGLEAESEVEAPPVAQAVEQAAPEASVPAVEVQAAPVTVVLTPAPAPAGTPTGLTPTVTNAQPQ
jgi:hypothetical protein